MKSSPPGLTGFSFRAGGVATEVVSGVGSYRVLSRKLPEIAPGRWFAVSSAPVFERHGAALLWGARGADLDSRPLLLPDGEAAKSWKAVGWLLDTLVARGLRRDGGVVALGGGTVGDAAGLAAALALRGVALVQAPTTLLAASDSCLGGKTAVDLPAGKNLAGTYHPARLVVVEPSVFDSLPERDYRSGLAEIVKTSLLSKSLYTAMGRLAPRLAVRDRDAVAEAAGRSLRIKARFVVADPFERLGKRFFLNLGHTVGHALEAASGFRLKHGEAVAWGLLAALVLSTERTGLDRSTAVRAAAWVLELARPPRPAASVLSHWPAMLGADKKADRLGLRAVLLSAPGAPTVVRVSADDMAEALRAALARYNP
jgi:3-dehydroquinate synthase